MRVAVPNPLSIFGFSGFLLLAAVMYNTVLAFINAHGVFIGTSHVALTEALIIFLSLGYIGLNIRAFPNIFPQTMFLTFMLLIFTYVSLMNEHFFPKSFRDMLLIVVFFMVGGLSSEKSLIATFKFITVVILVFMIVENYMTDFYVSLFKPASYYANTRGVEELSVDTSGLFRNSLGYEGRFSFGFLSHHRLSSIFLEQVSLANFAMVLAIFTCTFWTKILRWDRVLFFMTITLIILTNSSRTGSLVCILIFIGYFVFPRLPRFTNMLYMPAILILCALIFYDPHFSPYRMTDDMSGRIGNTLYFLSHLNTALFTGGPLRMIAVTADSGYTYVILTQTLFGLLAFWFFTSFIIPQSNENNKRFVHGMSLYIYLNLLIGAAIFSIKVSAPLWYIAGFLYYQKYTKLSSEAVYDPR